MSRTACAALGPPDLDARRRVDLDVATGERPAADRAERQEGVANGSGADVTCRQLVGEALDVLPAKVLELRGADSGST